MRDGFKDRHIGVSLLEMLLVVSLASIILLIALHFFRETQLDTEVTKSINTVQKINGAAFEWLQAQKQMDFCGPLSGSISPVNVSDCTTNTISTEVLLNNGLITPYDSCDNQPCLLTPWGTQIKTEPALLPTEKITSTPSGAEHIRIWLANVPNNVMCKQFDEDLKSNSPTGVEHGCVQNATGYNDFYIEF